MVRPLRVLYWKLFQDVGLVPSSTVRTRVDKLLSGPGFRTGTSGKVVTDRYLIRDVV